MNYLQIIETFYPTDQVYCTGDSSVYSNITWISSPSRTQAELDGKELDMNKIKKNGQIDIRTQELIFQGFTYDGQTFSLSEMAQLNWVAMEASSDLLTWPVVITTKDDSEYSLTLANSPYFYGAALSTKQAHLNSGRALKLQVNAATTIAEVDAVIDNR